MIRRLAWLGCLSVSLLLGACTTLPAPVAQAPALTLVAPPAAPLATLARDLPPGRSAVRALPISSYALDARLTLIRQARVSLDLQTYLIADDSIGHLILRELRDAAARGVRVRLLVDDMYTDGMTELLLGLAAHDHVELRLFNPFAYGRDLPWLKAWNFVTDFRRLNHRMHNKLFVADGVAAIVGGRNLADEYFFRSRDGNFIDFELLATGALVPELSRYFDQYWNSPYVFDIQAVASNSLDRAERRAQFERLTRGEAPPPPAGPDPFGVLALSQSLQQALSHERSHEQPNEQRHEPSQEPAASGPGLGLVVVEASCFADPPSKIAAAADHAAPSVMSHFIARLHEARSSIVMFSPYFVPGAQGLEQLRQAREAGIDVAVVTNALAASDEPLVSEGYGKYREPMLRMGVQLYEISSRRLHRDREIGRLLGSSAGRLHAKVAFIDRKMLLVGSMNLDPRSARTNTELGVAVRSPELTAQAAAALRVDDRRTGVFEVRLDKSGKGVEWVGRDADGEETLADEPEAGWWQRLRLKLLGLLVPEDLL